MRDGTVAIEVLDPSALFGFPEDAGFSLENNHFYLDDHRYPAFCVAMQRAHQRGLNGVTQNEVLSAWQQKRSQKPYKITR